MKQFLSYKLDTSNQCLWKNRTQIALPPKPFSVLRYLVENPGRLITHDELLDALWPETYVQPQVLRTYVQELRKVLGDDPSEPRYIQTLPKRGYCFVAPVAEATEPAPQRTQPSALQPADPQPEIAIVGREKELAQLMTALDPLASGQRQVAFITGDAGIGKSALVEAFATLAAASSSPVTVARSQCVEGFGRKEEYYPVMEALGQLCASSDGESAFQVLSRIAPAWLMPGAHDAEKDPAADSKRRPGELCAALEELAAVKPLILIFEDLHWSDVSTLDLISALARRRASARLMIVATCSPRNMAADHPLKSLKQDLLMRRLCIEVAPAPLPRAAVADLLSRELKQQSLPPGLTEFVHQHSEGNPLFVIATLEHLIAERFLVRRQIDGSDGRNDGSDGSGSASSAQWQQRTPFQEMEAGVPDGLAQMIELEMERLTPEEQRMLEAGSLMPVAFPAWAVAAALEQDPAEIEEACEALAHRLHFLNRAGQDELPDGSISAFYVFAHGLYREVLLQRQSASRRARRHTRIALRLGELFAGREAIVAREMALHFEAAGNWQQALQSLRHAAHHAIDRQSPTEANELLERALRVAENLPEPEREAVLREVRDELKKVQESSLDLAKSGSGTPAKA